MINGEKALARKLMKKNNVCVNSLIYFQFRSILFKKMEMAHFIHVFVVVSFFVV